MSFYKINNTAFLLDPTTGRWLERQSVGTDGLGRHIYPPLREYELKWDIIDVGSFSQLVNWFESIGATGTISVDLPMWNSSTGGFRTYSGCHLTEPVQDVLFADWPTSATMLVTGIRVS